MNAHRFKLMAFSHMCSPNRITGAEKYLLMMLQELRNPYDCTLVVPSPGMLADFAAELDIQVEIIPYPLLWSLYKPEPNMEEEIRSFTASAPIAPIIDMLHNYSPDLIITNTCVNLAPALAAKEMGIPVLWIINEVISHTPYTAFALTEIVKHTDLLIGCSLTTLIPFNNYHINKHVLYPSIREGELSTSQWNTERVERRAQLGIVDINSIHFGIIASDLVPQKGIRDFVEMSQAIYQSHPTAHFTLIGNPSEDKNFDNQILSMIEQSGHSAQFHHIPFTKNIETVYPSLDVVVVPSLVSEGFGMTAMEGMLFSKPIIAYRSGGLVELMVQTDNAEWILEQGDISGLTKAAARFIKDRQLRITKGALNRSAIINCFGIEAYRSRLQSILMVLNEMLESKVRQSDSVLYRYPDGTLLKGARSHTVFLLEDGCKRAFYDMNSFIYYRYSFDDVITVLDSELKLYPTGEFIRKDHSLRFSPNCFLAKGSGPTIYWVHSKVRHPFTSETVFHRLQFDFKKVVELPDSLLSILPMDYPITEDTLQTNGLFPYKYYQNPMGELFYMESTKPRKVSSYAEVTYFGRSESDFIKLKDEEYRAIRFKL
ncbi:glycosyltransferase family 4 protein [Paenibacillus sp. RC67]|uniref:glycosyltransferase family 4 protein n=1 Tax=Paenibacillus sp. RC67 TaxID=3039392 RepID=UPI0024ACE123|nr:glycosyltransferase family 4 protein [Paenibacillus sp. RC67]